MPTYELALLLRTMTRPEVVSTLKRTAQAIFDKGGFLRKLENYGTRELPYKISSHDMKHRQASYFVMKFDAPPSSLIDLIEEYSRDVDIIRRNIFKVHDGDKFECTIDEEMKPAPYRKDVQKMIAIGRKNVKPKFAYNTGLDYYPFQK